MYIDKIKNVLAKLDITSAITLNTNLQDNLGMDSQEVITMIYELEKEFNISLKKNVISRNETIGDLIKKIVAVKIGYKPLRGFEHTLIAQQILNVKTEKVYQSLHDVEQWPKYLPHVKKIEVKYNDGTYQEFNMHVKMENNSLIQVRSIRRCKEDTIEFFQPDPPVFLKKHCGSWYFDQIDNQQCMITTKHNWEKNENAIDYFQVENNQEANEKIYFLLENHAKFALMSWKNILETNGVNYA